VEEDSCFLYSFDFEQHPAASGGNTKYLRWRCFKSMHC